MLSVDRRRRDRLRQGGRVRPPPIPGRIGLRDVLDSDRRRRPSRRCNTRGRRSSRDRPDPLAGRRDPPRTSPCAQMVVPPELVQSANAGGAPARATGTDAEASPMIKYRTNNFTAPPFASERIRMSAEYDQDHISPRGFAIVAVINDLPNASIRVRLTSRLPYAKALKQLTLGTSVPYPYARSLPVSQVASSAKSRCRPITQC